MTRRRQWSQHHPRPPQGQRHHARKRLPTTPPLHTTDTATTSVRHEDTGRQTEATTAHTPQPYECSAASRITFSSPTASPPWNLMRGKVIFTLPLPLQHPKTDNTPMGTTRSYRPAQPYISSRRRSSNAEKDPATHTRVPAQADGAQQASAETVSAHYQEARIELEARMHSTSLSLRAPKPPSTRHCA